MSLELWDRLPEGSRNILLLLEELSRSSPVPTLNRNSQPHCNPRGAGASRRLTGAGQPPRMTDRQYMQRLQRRILEDHLETQRRRIQQREARGFPRPARDGDRSRDVTATGHVTSRRGESRGERRRSIKGLAALPEAARRNAVRAIWRAFAAAAAAVCANAYRSTRTDSTDATVSARRPSPPGAAIERLSLRYLWRRQASGPRARTRSPASGGAQPPALVLQADEAERERRLLLQGKLDPAALAASDNPAPALALRLSQLSRWLTDDPARTQEAKRRFNRQHRGQAQRAGRQQQQQLEDQQQQQQAEEGDSWEMGPSCDAPSRQLSATEEPPDGGERRKSRQQGRADSGAGDEEDSGFTQADYERLKYEAPLVKQLRSLETLDEMYSLAEEIVGPLRPVRAAKTAKGAF
ncbi:uncharacterized protein LOC126273278 [Schistocerca gregaria]|uniref:uncharacterized protein LOC126273278 n=1 Tax=Schistocerca gregaria TaxID=7010 RepID=UPI00211ECFCE|nr:uncharacterized protein LOC126273278 [Schistocerca gregaria]